MSIEVRPFRREDRGRSPRSSTPTLRPSARGSVSVAAPEPARARAGRVHRRSVVSERATLVAVQRGRVVAAAHLLRYAAEPTSESRTGCGRRSAGLFWPDAPAGTARSRPPTCASPPASRSSTAAADRPVRRRDAAVPRRLRRSRAVAARASRVRARRLRVDVDRRVETVLLADARRATRRRRPARRRPASRALGRDRRDSSSAGRGRGRATSRAARGRAHGVARAAIPTWRLEGSRCGHRTWRAGGRMAPARTRRRCSDSAPRTEHCAAFLESVGFRVLTRTERPGGVPGGTARPAT